MNMENRFHERIESFQQSLTLDQSLKKREEFAVALRKNKRTQEQLKRRNIQTDEIEVDSVWITRICPSYYHENTLERIKKLFDLIQTSITYEETQNLLQLICNLTKTGSIEVLKEASKPEYLSILKRILTEEFPDKTVELACWISANLIWGNPACVENLAKQNFFEILLRLINLERLKTTEQALWALSNLAGDDEIYRNYLVDLEGISLIKALIQPLKSTNASSCLICLSWLQANLSVGKRNLTENQKENIIENCLDLWENEDSELVHNCLLALEGISQSDTEGCEKIMQSRILNLVLSSLKSETRRVIKAALMVIGNIIAKSNCHTEEFLKLNLLDELFPFVRTDIEILRKETLYILSNIVGGNVSHIEQFLDHLISKASLEGLLDSDYESRLEASFIFSNICQAGNSRIVLQLLDTEFLIYASKFLENEEPRLLSNMMTALNSLLWAAQEEGREIEYLLYEIGVVEKIKDLRTHSNFNVSERADEILSDYFELELEDEEILCYD